MPLARPSNTLRLLRPRAGASLIVTSPRALHPTPAPRQRAEDEHGRRSISDASRRHRAFYTEIAPPMIKVLVIASIVYFALQLAWAKLDQEKQEVDYAERIGALERDLEELQEKARREEKEGSAVGAGPSGAERKKEGRKGWFGLW